MTVDVETTTSGDTITGVTVTSPGYGWPAAPARRNLTDSELADGLERSLLANWPTPESQCHGMFTDPDGKRVCLAMVLARAVDPSFAPTTDALGALDVRNFFDQNADASRLVDAFSTEGLIGVCRINNHASHEVARATVFGVAEKLRTPQ